MKKILAVMAALAVALTLVGCGVTDENGVNWTTYTKDKQNKIAYYAQIAPNTTLKGSWFVPGTTFFGADDTEGAIKGANQNYTVDYTNDSTTNAYRAYKETALKHAGAIIKVTFNSNNVSTSKMGVIFDLKADANNKDAKQFYIIGLNPRTDVLNFYVSKFTNVTDIQAYNFGTEESTTNTAAQNAAIKANPAKEIEVVALNTANNIKKIPTADADGNINFYVYYKLMADGSFDYAVLDITDDDLTKFKKDADFNSVNLDDFGAKVLVKGNTLAKCKAEYEAAPVGESKGGLF